MKLVFMMYLHFTYSYMMSRLIVFRSRKKAQKLLLSFSIIRLYDNGERRQLSFGSDVDETPVELPNDQIDKVVDLVKAKLNLDKAGDLLGGLGKMFGK